MLMQLFALLRSLGMLFSSQSPSVAVSDLPEPQALDVLEPNSAKSHFVNLGFQSTGQLQIRPLDEGLLYVTVFDKDFEVIVAVATVGGAEGLSIPIEHGGGVMIVVENFGSRSIGYTLTTTGEVVNSKEPLIVAIL